MSHIDPYTRVYPDEMPAQVVVTLTDGREFSVKEQDFHGFFTRPLSWSAIEEKFRRLTKERIDEPLQERIIDVIGHLDQRQVGELTDLPSRIPSPS